MTSYEQWRTRLPARGERTASAGPDAWRENIVSAAELWQRTYGSVQTTVEIPMAWPGLANLDDDFAAIVGRNRKRFGRWILDDTGLVCLGQDWDLDSERFEDADWLDYGLSRVWLYDPTDFFDALQEARRAFCAHRGEDWIDSMVWHEIRTVLKRGHQPVFPSTLVQGQRIYIASRMLPEERDAFALFLAQQGIHASD